MEKALQSQWAHFPSQALQQGQLAFHVLYSSLIAIVYVCTNSILYTIHTVQTHSEQVNNMQGYLMCIVCSNWLNLFILTLISLSVPFASSARTAYGAWVDRVSSAPSVSCWSTRSATNYKRCHVMSTRTTPWPPMTPPHHRQALLHCLCLVLMAESLWQIIPVIYQVSYNFVWEDRTALYLECQYSVPWCISHLVFTLKIFLVLTLL